MPISLTPITGRVPLPTDLPPINAVLELRLSAVETEGSDVILPGPVRVQLAADTAELPPGFALWQNTAGLAGTHYTAIAEWEEEVDGVLRRRRADLPLFQVDDDASISMGELMRRSVPEATGTFWSALTQAEYDAAIAAVASTDANADRAEDAAAAAAASAAEAAALATALEFIDTPAPAILWTALDANNDEIVLASMTTEGVFDVPGVTAETVGADSVTADALTVGGLPPALVEQYETIDDLGGAYIVDADDRIVGVIPTSANPDAGGTSYSPDDIRAYDATIDLTGQSDMSVRLKTAHDAAAADGLRHLFIEGPILAPSALHLGDVLFLTRSGKGRLIGTYRKRVVPVSAPTFPPLSRVVPARHLKRLAAKLATATPTDPAIIAYMSDSWGEFNEGIGPQSQFSAYLRREVAAQFGVDQSLIRVIDRAVGGMTWQDAAGTLEQGRRSWVTGVNLPWTNYVVSVEQPDLTPTARTPDVVLFMFGMNHGTPFTAADITAMRSVIATISAVTPKPDLLFCAVPTPSAQSPTRGTKAAQESRQGVAGFTRAYAARYGHGLIDLARTADAMHYGFDQSRLSFVRVAETQDIALPWTFPQACNDFGVDLVLTGSAATFWAGGPLTITIGPTAGNVVTLENVGGFVACTAHAATGHVSIPQVVSAVGIGTSDHTLTVSVLGETLIVLYRSSIVYQGPVERCWAEFTPTITQGAATPTVSLTRAYVGEAATVMPSLTDEDLWGTVNGPRGGNNENHLAEPGRAAIFGATLAATRFA